MIAKNIKGKGFAGCVRYVMNETCELLEAEGVLADSAESMIRSFAAQRSMRSEITKPVGHIPLSFAPEDKPRMTNDFMLQLAKEYMQEMGIGNTQYIIVRHHNTDNDHLHIVYNRIDNDLKLISVNNDYKRNIEVCKKLKDKHGLTYGEGKERVRREKLNHPDKAKYLIYDAIVQVLPNCENENDLKILLEKSRIETEFKLSRTTGEVQGISFSYGNISFKGSQVDRSFSFANLRKEFGKNKEMQVKQKEQAQQQASPVKRNLVILGVELDDQQEETLRRGDFILLENMNRNDGSGKFSSYIFLNDEQNKVFFSRENPDDFVKYGKYEMRIRDKILIENGDVVKAKVKWYGGGYAHPHLWKENKIDSEYKESWGDPRIAKVETIEKKPDLYKNITINRGRKR